MNNITLGSDPELVFLTHKEKRLVNAVSVITDPLGRDGSVGKFGWDGHKPICELRPDPSDTPEEQVQNIKSILRDGFIKNPDIQNLKWVAGSYPGKKPTGGHVHLGGIFDTSMKMRLLLDGLLLLPTLLMEDPKDALNRRSNNGYGQYGHLSVDDGEFRSRFAQLKEANAGHGIEYKAISSFIVSPGISLGVLAIAKAIGLASLVGDLGKLTKDDWNLIEVDKDQFYKCNKDAFYPKMDSLFKVMKDNFSYFNISPERILHVKSLLRKNPLKVSDIQSNTPSSYRSAIPDVVNIMEKANVIEKGVSDKYYPGEYFHKVNDSLPIESVSGAKYWRNVCFLKQVIKEFKIWDNNEDLKLRWGIISKDQEQDYISITSKEYFKALVKKKRNKRQDKYRTVVYSGNIPSAINVGGENTPSAELNISDGDTSSTEWTTTNTFIDDEEIARIINRSVNITRTED